MEKTQKNQTDLYLFHSKTNPYDLMVGGVHFWIVQKIFRLTVQKVYLPDFHCHECCFDDLWYMDTVNCSDLSEDRMSPVFFG
jgi:hypothetical protein